MIFEAVSEEEFDDLPVFLVLPRGRLEIQPHVRHSLTALRARGRIDAI
jgi:hypothetical protein